MSELRFAILHHCVGPSLNRTDQSHFDWMFQIDGSLRTWATQPVDQFETTKETMELMAERLPDHRTMYLDYEGALSNDRGAVTRVLAGTLQIIEDATERFVGQLSWRTEPQDHTGFVICQRINVESDPPVEEIRAGWSLSFSPGRYETKR